MDKIIDIDIIRNLYSNLLDKLITLQIVILFLNIIEFLLLDY